MQPFLLRLPIPGCTDHAHKKVAPRLHENVIVFRQTDMNGDSFTSKGFISIAHPIGKSKGLINEICTPVQL